LTVSALSHCLTRTAWVLGVIVSLSFQGSRFLALKVRPIICSGLSLAGSPAKKTRSTRWS